MDLEIRHLKLVVAVHAEKSITRAGNRLHLTQSALSHQLKNIEERLGAALFHRIDKKMIITPAGERLLTTANEILSNLQRAEEDIKQIASEQMGVLRISTQCYTCYNWLPDLLLIFNEKNPGFEVDIVVEATREPLQFLLDGKLDVAILNREVRDKRLAFKPLFKDELVVIMNPAHRLAQKSFIRAEDFADEKLIIHNTLQENSVFQMLLAPAGVMPGHVSQVQLTEAIIEMARAGLGIGVLAKWAVKDHLQSKAIQAVRLTPKGFHRQWSAAIIKSRQTPRHLLEFINLISTNSNRITGNQPQTQKY